jgi:hypothetical protein
MVVKGKMGGYLRMYLGQEENGMDRVAPSQRFGPPSTSMTDMNWTAEIQKVMLE